MREIHSTGNDMNASYGLEKEILDFHADSALAFDDLTTLGILKYLKEQKHKVPEDVAVIGFDNLAISTLPNISLTSVDIPKLEIGS